MFKLEYNKSYISPLKDPFNKESFDGLSIFINKRIFGEGYRVIGNIDFENNMTKGTQTFEADSFDELVLKMKTFLDNLK